MVESHIKHPQVALTYACAIGVVVAYIDDREKAQFLSYAVYGGMVPIFALFFTLGKKKFFKAEKLPDESNKYDSFCWLA